MCVHTRKAARTRACTRSLTYTHTLLCVQSKPDQASEIEKKILGVGRTLLKANKIDKFRALSWISNFMANREYLLDKAAMFLAKV